MNTKVMGAEEVRREWRTVVDSVIAGEDVVVERYSRPAVAVIAYADYEAILEELEDLRAARRADAIRDAWLNGKVKGIPWEEAKAELRANGLLDE
jgi:prevent-host-death family protein